MSLTNKSKLKMNKIALITGSSSGIGEGCARIFAKAGFNLILLARREEKLKNLSLDLISEYKIEVSIIVADVRNYEELNLKINDLDEKWKKIDVLINNAGLARGLEKFQNALLSDWEEMIDTNIKGLLYVSKIVIPFMIERASGLIINIGSIAGEVTYPSGSVYCGSKSAVKSISEGMSIDLINTGIKVCNIEPGMVETEFSIVRFHGDAERSKAVYKDMEPLLGTDIGEIALYLSKLPQRVNIQNILVTPTSQANVYINKKTVK